MLLVFLCAFFAVAGSVSAQSPRPFPANLPTCLEDDFRRLEALYDSTGGSTWLRRDNWFNANMATWYGIRLTSDGCDVEEINLSNNNLTNDLPRLALPRLTYLYLNNNNLSGSVQLNLPNLKELELAANSFSGSFPVLNTPNLEILILADNTFSGNIPPLNYDFLFIINVLGNNFSGAIPAINCPRLEILSLGENQLTGAIPNFNLPMLQDLSLYRNRLTGTIPNFNLPNLQLLQLEDNQLSGLIPNFSLPELTHLYLSKNNLEGEIPVFNMPKLEQFNLSENNLVGLIPDIDAPNLTHIDLNYNTLTGSIPNFNSLKLEYIYLNNNQLTGNIPLFNARKLRVLDVSFNRLTGNVPRLTLENPLELYINDNNLTGKLPNFSRNITAFDISNNKFVFGNLENVVWINAASSSERKYAPQKKVPIVFTNRRFTVSVGTNAPLRTTYTWYRNNVFAGMAVADSTFSPSAVGTYSCSIRHSSFSDLTLYSEESLATNTNDPDMTLNVSPTLTDGIVEVQNIEATAQNIEVFDMIGQKMATFDVENASFVQINIAHLPKGNYVLKLGNRTAKITRY